MVILLCISLSLIAYEVSIQYNSKNEVSVVTYPNGYSISYNYDSHGNLINQIISVPNLTPLSPTQFTITYSGSNKVLSWDAVTNSEGGSPITISSYMIEVSDNPETDYILIGTTNQTQYTDTNSDLQRRFYRVIANIDESTIVIQPSSEGTDVWVTSVYYGGGLDDDRLVVGGWADNYWSLIKFDLTNLPANVQSAKILLYSYYYTGTSHPTMYLDRVTSTWSESTKWNTKPTYSNINIIPAAVNNQWYEIDVTALYNNWKNGTYTNYGIQLRPTNTSNSYNTFRSSDYAVDPTLRPKLVLIP